MPADELGALYRGALCVVAPALDEDYGLTALEAMLHGKPVIVCRDGGGLADLVEDGVTGIVVEPDGPSIAAAVASLTADPERCRRARRQRPQDRRGLLVGARPGAGGRRDRDGDGIVKVAVVAPSPVPFVLGGAERLVNGLVRAINELTPHDAELLKLPSREHNLPDLMATYRAFRALDVSHFDLVISTKYPSWMIDHPHHVVYMLHPLRGLYETYPADWPGEPQGPFEEPALARLVTAASGPVDGRHADLRLLDRWDECLDALGRGHPAFAFPGPLARLLVRRLDSIALDVDRTSAHFAISATVTKRPGYFPARAHPRAVIPPTDLAGLHTGGADGFFTASRLDGPKRLDLLIDAMAFVTAPVTLTIAGTGPDDERLRTKAAEDPRVSFVGHISDEALTRRYADALAVPFVPADEDLGYITLEAFLSGTTVVTCADSGGPTELVVDGVNGYVSTPDPRSLGSALQRVAEDPATAIELGRAGARRAHTITWAGVVAELLSTSPRRSTGRSDDHRSTPHATDRPRILTLSTYPIAPASHGGQIRLSHLQAALAEDFDVEFLCLDLDGSERSGQIAPGLFQTIVQRTMAFHQFDGALHASAGIPTTDVAVAAGWQHIPELIRELRRATKACDLVVLGQPYLLPVLQAVAPTMPFVYDAQNAEYLMKADLYNDSLVGAELAGIVEQVERDAVRRAELVVACSEADVEALERLGPTLAEWCIVPNGADVLRIPFTTGDQRRAGRERWLARYMTAHGGTGLDHLALFVASYHPPNLRAAEQIVQLATSCPDVLFVMVGEHVLHLRSWRLPENVLLRGFVPRRELLRLLSVADIALNPMAAGGGSNLKLVEYFAGGVPVVSTEFGARGFGAVDDHHLRLAEPHDFLRAIRQTLDHPETATRARNARALAEERYDWSVIGAAFTARIAATVAERRTDRHRPARR